MTIRILLADDHGMMREGLRTLLEAQPEIEVIGEAGSGMEAVKLAQELSPEIVVMDVGMPDLNGVEATRQILSVRPEIKVLALSVHSESQFVMGMFKAGARGYLLKESAFWELTQAIRTVNSDLHYISPKVSAVVLEFCFGAQVPRDSCALTAREGEVFKLLVEGKSVKEVAEMLDLSWKTVDKHRQQIMKKLGVHKATELVRYAFQRGMI